MVLVGLSGGRRGGARAGREAGRALESRRLRSVWPTPAAQSICLWASSSLWACGWCGGVSGGADKRRLVGIYRHAETQGGGGAGGEGLESAGTYMISSSLSLAMSSLRISSSSSSLSKGRACV